MYKDELNNLGFSSTSLLYSDIEIEKICSVISEWQNRNNEKTQTQVFSIRRLLQNIPELHPLLFIKPLKNLIRALGNKNTSLVKAIYFDKPKDFNWFVSYHQDISITVNKKQATEGYTRWTAKHEQIGVVPPTNILENVFTIRIHLDDTDETNGALRVIPKSHLNGIQQISEIAESKKNKILCPIKKGHAMLMKLLTFHASSKSKMTNRRRVIHLEFSSMELQEPLKWREKSAVFF